MTQVPLILRPVVAHDRPFLQTVFNSTRPDVLFSNLPTPQKEEFLEFQFRAQDTHYRNVYPNAQYSVVLAGNEKIGRLYVDRRPDELRVIDIALLPKFRGCGYGAQLMRDILDEARNTARPVRIHVDLGSRQVQFYERLGFTPINVTPPHQLMEWRGDGRIIHDT